MDNSQQSINVLNFLPHRPPFLFVDTATVDKFLEHVRTVHFFRPEEPYFEGHFPRDPIVPGVVLIECMAQACRILLNIRSEKIVPGFLVGVETARFLSLVRPNQTVSFNCRLDRSLGNMYSGGNTSAQQIYTFRCTAFIDDVRCARAHLNLYQKK